MIYVVLLYCILNLHLFANGGSFVPPMCELINSDGGLNYLVECPWSDPWPLKSFRGSRILPRNHEYNTSYITGVDNNCLQSKVLGFDKNSFVEVGYFLQSTHSEDYVELTIIILEDISGEVVNRWTLNNNDSTAAWTTFKRPVEVKATSEAIVELEVEIKGSAEFAIDYILISNSKTNHRNCGAKTSKRPTRDTNRKKELTLLSEDNSVEQTHASNRLTIGESLKVRVEEPDDGSGEGSGEITSEEPTVPTTEKPPKTDDTVVIAVAAGTSAAVLVVGGGVAFWVVSSKAAAAAAAASAGAVGAAAGAGAGAGAGVTGAGGAGAAAVPTGVPVLDTVVTLPRINL